MIAIGFTLLSCGVKRAPINRALDARLELPAPKGPIDSLINKEDDSKVIPKKTKDGN